MEYRPGRPEDLDSIVSLVQAAIAEMERRGIHQWDEVYPARADFALDIEKETLYMALSNDVPVGIYVISTEADEAYKKVAWKQADDRACILHRLCVLPTVQNQGVGYEIMQHVEEQAKAMGYTSLRLDVFTDNPFSNRLYEKCGYEKRGYADWRKGRFWLMEKIFC